MERTEMNQKDFLAALQKQLIGRLTNNGAHASIEDALSGLNNEQAAMRSEHMPYSIYDLTKHISIAQHDILEFCSNPDYKAHKWPDDYWPKKDHKPTQQEWNLLVSEIKSDFEAFMLLVENGDLLKPFAYGDGQSLFMEALLIIDHASYHTGQIVLIRKMNGWWK